MAKRTKKKINPREQDASVNKEIGGRIQEKRKSAGLGITELGVKVGRSAAAISRYENGLAPCDAPMLVRLSEALKCTASYLLDGITL